MHGARSKPLVDFEGGRCRRKRQQNAPAPPPPRARSAHGRSGARPSGATSRECGENDTVNPETTAFGGLLPGGIRGIRAGAAAT